MVSKGLERSVSTFCIHIAAHSTCSSSFVCSHWSCNQNNEFHCGNECVVHFPVIFKQANTQMWALFKVCASSNVTPLGCMYPLGLCHCAGFLGSRQQNFFMHIGTVWQTFSLKKWMQSLQRRQWSYARWKPMRMYYKLSFLYVCILGGNPRGSFPHGNKCILIHHIDTLLNFNLQVATDVDNALKEMELKSMGSKRPFF